MEFTKTDQPAIAMDSKCGANPSDEGPIDLQDEHGVGTAEILLLPDGGYGWVCVTAVLLINAHTWGISTCYSVFLSHYLQTSTLRGATPLHYAFIGGLQYSQSFMISPLAVWITGKSTIRTCLLLGVVVQTGALIGASFATTIWHLYLAQGLLFGWGVGLFLTGTQNNVAQWFDKRRSLASGIAASGTGIGGLVYALAAGEMIQALGVPWALRVLAFASCAVNFVASMLLRDRNEQIMPRYKLIDSNVLKQRRFLVLLWFAGLSMLGELVVLTQIPAYGSAALGLNGTQSSVVGSMIALGQIFGRISIGFFSDRAGRLNMATLVTFLAGLWTLVVWPNANSYGVLIVFSIFIGAFAGAFWSIIAPVTAEIMGMRVLPTSLSMTFLVLVLPTTFSPVIGVKLIESHGGSYIGVQLFTGLTFVGSALFCWLLRTWRLSILLEGNNSGRTLPSQESTECSSAPSARNFSRSTLSLLFRLAKV